MTSDGTFEQLEIEAAEALESRVSLDQLYKALPDRMVEFDKFKSGICRWASCNVPTREQTEPPHVNRSKLARIADRANGLRNILEELSPQFDEDGKTITEEETLHRLMGALGGEPETLRSYARGSQFILQFKLDLIQLKNAANDAAGSLRRDRTGRKIDYAMRDALEQLMDIWRWSTGRKRLGERFQDFAIVLLNGVGFILDDDEVTDHSTKTFKGVRATWNKRAPVDGVQYLPPD